MASMKGMLIFYLGMLLLFANSQVAYSRFRFFDEKPKISTAEGLVGVPKCEVVDGKKICEPVPDKITKGVHPYKTPIT